MFRVENTLRWTENEGLDGMDEDVDYSSTGTEVQEAKGKHRRHLRHIVSQGALGKNSNDPLMIQEIVAVVLEFSGLCTLE